MTHRQWWIIEGCTRKWKDRESLSRQGWVAAIKHCTRKTNAQQLKQAITFLNRALCSGGSTRRWMEDVNTFIRSVEKQQACV